MSISDSGRHFYRRVTLAPEPTPEEKAAKSLAAALFAPARAERDALARAIHARDTGRDQNTDR